MHTPRAVFASRQSLWGEDFETALLNQPLKDFQYAVAHGKVSDCAALEGVRVEVDAALAQAETSAVSAQTDLESLRLLVDWMMTSTLSRESPPAIHRDIQLALHFLAQRCVSTDIFAVRSAEIATIQNQKAIQEHAHDWREHKDEFILAGSLTLERMQAVEAMEAALQQWEQSGDIQPPPSIAHAQWKVVCAFIRPVGEMQFCEKQVVASIRNLLRSPLEHMYQMWSIPRRHSFNTSATDLRQRMTALQRAGLTRYIGFETWMELESIQSAWLSGSTGSTEAWGRVKRFFRLKAAEVAVSKDIGHTQNVGTATALNGKVAKLILERPRLVWDVRKNVLVRKKAQDFSGSAGGDGLPVPLIREMIGRQIFDYTEAHFREPEVMRSILSSLSPESSALEKPPAEKVIPQIDAEKQDPFQELEAELYGLEIHENFGAPGEAVY